MLPLPALLLAAPLVVPALAHAHQHAGHSNSRWSSRSSHRNDQNLSDRSLQQLHAGTVEARLARRGAGKQLARRAAAAQCRAKGSKVTLSAAVVGSSATATASAAGSSSTASAAASASSASSSSNAAAAAVSTSSAASDGSGSGISVSVGVQVGSSSSASSSGSTPNGIKAGISGGDAYDYVKDHIGWWYDWSADPSGHSGSPIAVPMLWGAGTVDTTDSSRLASFKSISSPPAYIIGFEEPDCSTSGSANIDVGTAAGIWNAYVAPLGAAGSMLVSPSMCHQAAESGWLQPFQEQITRGWDLTNLHINKNSADGIKADLDHYWDTYGKPMWITEFACVDDSTGFVPCTDQDEIDSFIQTAVGIFESDSRVAAYAYSNGAGLGDVWPMMSNGQLSASGQTYLNAISAYH